MKRFSSLLCAIAIAQIAGSILSRGGYRYVKGEKEMLELILNFANQDERIRAVIMNGSRVNPIGHRDIFQDYDIVFMVSAVDEFVRDRSWISDFGDLIIMQTPDENALIPSDRDCFAFQMLFRDGNRIDLTLYPLEKLNTYVPESLSVVLMDKDNMIGQLPPPNNTDYVIAPRLKVSSAVAVTSSGG